MNRRQRKKHFKKIYGMNPKQYEKWQRENMPKILMERALQGASEAFKALGEAAKEAAEIVAEAITAWGEQIQVAAGYIETDEMLREANLMPEGAEKDYLKHIGIRMDRYGAAYDFYYDEANKAYFVEVLQEGGESGC